MELKAVGYFVFRSPQWEEWLQVARRMMRVHIESHEGEGWARFRIDDRLQRVLLERTQAGEKAVIPGFEVHGNADLEGLSTRLTKLGIAIHAGTAIEHERRGVERFVWFFDPEGNRIEAYVGLKAAVTPFNPVRPIGGFRTGPLGAGHIVMATQQFDAMSDFYLNTLGFKVSDFCYKPFRAKFMHMNPRHHSFAMIESDWHGVQHVMFEYLDLDDVGRAYDVALETPELIGQTLGRHSNDHMTSFYFWTPDRFLMELGWAGRLVGDDWEPEELIGPSLWGHERHWLPPERREQAREVRDIYSQRGIRAPVVMADVDELPPGGAPQSDRTRGR